MKGILLSCALFAASTSFAQISDQLTPARSVHINGFIGGKLDASYHNRILAQDENRLIAPFRERTETRCWQSEFWGKWFTSAVLAYRYHPDPELKKKLDNAVQGLIATQTPDGYIGNYAADKRLQAWDIWGRKYCMLGLIAYYDLTQNKASLKAARKVADHLMQELSDKQAKIVMLGNHHGMAATSVLEPVALLYSRTKEKKYLDFAEAIVAQWESADGPQLITKSTVDVSKRFPKPDSKDWFGWKQGQKAYEMMSCYEGLLELYRITGKPAYYEAVERTWDNILRTEINVAGSGSAMECWFGGQQLQTLPVKHYQETCVTATWVKLSQQLLRLTGESKYADAIEQTFYNALLGSMTQDGAGWAKYTPLSGIRMPGSEQCNMGINCCEASGPRGLFTLPSTVVMQDRNGCYINFYVDGDYELPNRLHIQQQTDYPASGDVRITVKSAGNHTVRLRIPEWSKKTSVWVNGELQENVQPGGYLPLQRNWKADDSIRIALDMRGRMIKTGDNGQLMAIVRGPVVLTRDVRLGGPDNDMPLNPVADKDGYINLRPVSEAKKDIWMQFSATFYPESYREGPSQPASFLLCDYASAGNTNDEASRFRVWLPRLIDPMKMP
jgi:hypothetical protein